MGTLHQLTFPCCPGIASLSVDEVGQRMAVAYLSGDVLLYEGRLDLPKQPGR